MSRKKILTYIQDFIIITFGSLLFASSVNALRVPNGLVEGGISGIALIIFYLKGIPVGVIYFVLNIPILIIGWKYLGKEIVIKSIYATVVISVFTSILKLPSLTDNTLLATVYAGISTGIGIGIIFIRGGTTGGADIIAKILLKYRGIPVGKGILAFDFLVLSFAAFNFGLEIVMYTLVSAAISSKLIDSIQEGFDSAKGLMVFTKESEMVKDKIIEETGRGVTFLIGKGGYSNIDMQVLYCVVSKYQLLKVKKIIKEVDPRAFMTITNVHEVLGEGFKRLENN